MRSKISVFLIFTLFTFKIYGFPIFYSCENEELIDSNKVDPNNLFEKILKLDKNKQNQLITSWCKGKQECLKNLKNLMIFSESSYDVAEQLFLEELEKQKLIIGEKIKSSELITNYFELTNSFSELRACQEVSSRLNPMDFVDDWRLLVFYPYHNNYMYVTGCKSISSKNCLARDRSSFDSVIENAIAMNTDPYLALALNFMESDTDIGSLYLDPIAVMDSIGCSAEQVANGSDDSFFSFGTSYKIKAQVINNKKLSSKIQNYIGLQDDRNLKEGESFYCYNVKKGSPPAIHSTPQDNSCCLRVNFTANGTTTEENINHDLARALKYEFINKRLSPSFRGKTEPEWKIQRYNGYTELMGAAEWVPSWRMGVNYYDNPGYGQQAMDFILNSFMFNPYIKNKIEEESSKYDTKWKSILCRNKEDGLYFYDSDHYMNLVKSSPRLESIYEKYKNGVKFNELTVREKAILERELKETSQNNSLVKDTLPQAIANNYLETLNKGMDLEADELFSLRMLTLSELYNKIKDQTQLRENDIKGFHEYIIKSKQVKEEKRITEDRLKQIEAEAYDICFDSKDQIHDCNDYINKIRDLSQNSPLKDFLVEIKSVKAPAALENIAENYKNIATNYHRAIKNEAHFYQTQMEVYNDVFNTCAKHKDTCLLIHDSVYELDETLPEAINRLRQKPGYKVEFDNKISALYTHHQNLSKKIDHDKAMKEYFENIYSSRKTLGDTSDYSWRKLSEKELKKILRKIKQ